MAEVAVTIRGTLYPLAKGSTPGAMQVVLQGDASLTGLGVGGGPVYPPEGGGGEPPSIWPSPGYPAHPIAPGGPPPSVWPGPGHPEHPIFYPPGVWPSPGRPAHPIVLPPDGGKPPIDPPTEPPTSPANPQWSWGYSPTYSQWLAVYVPGEGQAGPK